MWARKRRDHMLELRLFGPGRAFYGSSSLPGFPEQLPYQLLCYLVLTRGQAQRREHLAGLLWGDCPTPVSLKHLRTLLWRLRQSLRAAGVPPDEYVRVDEGCVCFSRAGHYSLDVEVFETTMLRYQSVAGCDLAPEQAGDMEAALQVYTGDLLEGIYQDWCLLDRQRLHALYLSSVAKLLSHHRQRGNYLQSLAYGQRMLALDETLERTHRQVMRLHWLMGDRNAALEQYRHCVEVLSRTLQVAPSEATRRLYWAILHGDPPERTGTRRPRVRAVGNAAQETAPLLLTHAMEQLELLQKALSETRAELAAVWRLINGPQGPADE